MKHLSLAALALPLLCSFLAAQPTGPAKEMKKLDVLLGDWVGKGTASAPGQPSSQWTSRSTTKAIMGGIFLRTETVIEIPAGPQTLTLAFLGLMTYDPATKRYMSYSVGNNGEYAAAEMHWLDDTTTISMSSGFNMGQPMVERWTTTIKNGVQHFHGDQLLPTGSAFTHVKGSQKKVSDMKPIDLAKIGSFMVEPSAQMQKLHRMNGDYSLAGQWAMGHDQEMQSFTGKETLRPLFGGLVQEAVGSGDGYEGYGFMVWDERDHCFRRASFNNWGMAHEVKGSFLSDSTMIFHFSGEMMGQQMLTRTTLVLDDAGKLVSSSAYALSDNNPPFKSFSGKYAPTKGSK